MQDVQVQSNPKPESIPLGKELEHIQEGRVSLS